ncbi:kinase-like domain-containing protein [Podospora didyma]|uniref:Kinase-like domain-containing protein n=1 Tax=Podospora didyma TaxID=330526 RepID=A0AAE0U0W7_9PEZI|nr:kinase-like domain-containing protein [Podospora didyma]
MARESHRYVQRHQDLLSLVEEFDFKDGSLVREFIRTVFVAMDDDDKAFWGTMDVRKYGITDEEYERALEPVPDDWVFPKASPNLIIAPNDGVGDDLFIKRPKIKLYDPVKVSEYLPIASLILNDELQIFELLSKHPQHPNIVRYHGCRIRRGRVTGLVMDRHGVDLDSVELHKELRANVDKVVIMAGIESAVVHLHSLGLAHNDLNPSNIVLSKDNKNTPILINFGSRQPFGGRLLSAGTTGWVDEKYSTSDKKHDLAALPKIRKWLGNVLQDGYVDDRSCPVEGHPAAPPAPS